jgi:DNA-directed DNA polymerase III PolC
MAKKVPQDKKGVYRERLIEELDVIEELGFSSYMLIVADYIDFCRKNNIPTGDGRGSVGGCLTAYLMDIHQADPIQYDLIFPRFLNKFKAEYPDIDSDFASFGKELVTKYIINKYGADYVAAVSNINTITPKVYARDIARAHQFGGDRKAAVEIGMSIADAIPDDIKTLKQALDRAPLFIEFAESKEYAPLKKFADDLGGLPRAWSTHAGGLIIGKRPLHEIVPVRRDKDGRVAIEYEKERAEANGLVKMDILGLSTLDVVANTLKIIEACGKPLPVNHVNYDRYDQETYDLISRGDTLCVFQLGKSAGTIDLCRKVKPKTIEDIAIINSLARPSARDIREDFIKTKNGEKPVEIMHPTLNRAFGATYGFGLYEECLMYLAQDVAGWDLHHADRLRKLTKQKGKNPQKAKEWKREFIKDAIANGVEADMAKKIWTDVVDKFQGYGFNKSHAIFYSMLGFKTAFLKAHYPVEFLTANLILEDDSNAKISDKNISRIKREMRRSGIKILPPDLNKSDKVYRILDGKSLLTGFNSLKYMGKDAIPEILAKRPFSSFEDFLSRVDGRKVRVTAVQALAASGSLDGFGHTRKEMFLYASDYKKKLQVWNKKQDKLEKEAKKAGEPYSRKPFEYPWPEDTGEWTMPEMFAQETYYMGEGFCCGIEAAYDGFFNLNHALDLSTLADIFPEPEDPNEKYFLSAKEGIVQGVVRDYFEFKVKNEKSKIFGETMAKIDIEDPYGNIVSMTMFPSGLEQFNDRCRALTSGKAKLEPGIGVYCSASANWYEGDVSLIFEDLKKATPIPPRPSDLKHRTVKMKTSRTRKKTTELDPDKFLNLVEDELIEDGHAELLD